MQSIEHYLEDNQVYELFESLGKQLVIHRPDNPIDFLIQKLANPERKLYKTLLPKLLRVFVDSNMKLPNSQKICNLYSY